MPLDLTDDVSILVHVMAWCRQATSRTWANVDPNLCRHMVSPGHNVLRRKIGVQSFPIALQVGTYLGYIATESLAQCQIEFDIGRAVHFTTQSCVFETFRDFPMMRLIRYWNVRETGYFKASLDQIFCLKSLTFRTTTNSVYMNEIYYTSQNKAKWTHFNTFSLTLFEFQHIIAYWILKCVQKC